MAPSAGFIPLQDLAFDFQKLVADCEAVWAVIAPFPPGADDAVMDQLERWGLCCWPEESEQPLFNGVATEEDYRWCVLLGLQLAVEEAKRPPNG